MELLQGPLIRTKYLCPTNKRDARIKATHKREAGRTFSVTLLWDDDLDGLENARIAALKLLEEWPFREHHEMVLVACGFDHDHYYFIASTAPITNPA